MTKRTKRTETDEANRNGQSEHCPQFPLRGMGLATDTKVALAPGIRVGRLMLLRRVDATDRARWLCLCDCGNDATVRADRLASRKTRSCGCLHDEYREERRLSRGSDRAAYLRHIWRTRGTLYAPRDEWILEDGTRKEYAARGYRIVRDFSREAEAVGAPTFRTSAAAAAAAMS